MLEPQRVGFLGSSLEAEAYKVLANAYVGRVNGSGIYNDVGVKEIIYEKIRKLLDNNFVVEQFPLLQIARSNSLYADQQKPHLFQEQQRAEQQLLDISVRTLVNVLDVPLPQIYEQGFTAPTPPPALKECEDRVRTALGERFKEVYTMPAGIERNKLLDQFIKDELILVQSSPINKAVDQFEKSGKTADAFKQLVEQFRKTTKDITGVAIPEQSSIHINQLEITRTSEEFIQAFEEMKTILGGGAGNKEKSAERIIRAAEAAYAAIPQIQQSEAVNQAIQKKQKERRKAPESVRAIYTAIYEELVALQKQQTQLHLPGQPLLRVEPEPPQVQL